MNYTTREDILKAFQQVMLDAMKATRDHGLIGADDPEKLVGNWRLFVWFASDKGEHMEGEDQRRLVVYTKVMRRDDHDTAAGATELLRVSSMFQVMVDAVRRSADTPTGSPFEGLALDVSESESSPGIVCAGFDTPGGIASIAASWDVTYRRKITL